MDEQKNTPEGRRPDGRFQKGVSGNPKGRPKKKNMTKEEMVDEMWSVFEEMLPNLRKDLKKMKERDRWALINQLRKTFLTDARPEEPGKDDNASKEISVNIVFGEKPKEDKMDEPMND